MQDIVILGSTGSVGCNTLEVIKNHRDKYKVTALVAKSQHDKLFYQCIEFEPKYAILLDKDGAKNLADKLKLHNSSTMVLSDLDSINWIVQLPNVDIVMSAIVGSQGLMPTFNAIKAGKKVLLANKESLIAGGKLLMQELQNSKAELIPVDSEHSAIFQCLNGAKTVSFLNKIILTASGGPFLNFSFEELKNVTPENAVKHPNWSMGKKISVDSSTLMNKGLEVIEAHWLFNMPSNKIEVLIHPQSIIHSMVEYIDGSVIAQLGSIDMKIPIAYALSYPKRIESGSKKLDLTQFNGLTFAKPDTVRFPCLQLAFDALNLGAAATTALNASNEMAVAAFLNKHIQFYDINKIVDKAIDKFGTNSIYEIEDIIHIDNIVRQYTLDLL